MADRQSRQGAVTYDPGADASARYPDWVIRHCRIGWGIPEVLCRRAKVILIEAKSTRAEQRCSLAHAVAHLDLAHEGGQRSWFDKRQESAANQLAARRLIPMDALTDVLAWTRRPVEVAHELGVDLATLRCRHRHLRPSERALLTRLTEELEEGSR